MNTALILSTIIAFIAGSFVGVNVDRVEAPEADTANQVQMQEEVYTPDPIDFVSMRPTLASLPADTISAEEQEDLLYMREEEKLARDVYMTLYEKWNLQIFANIAQSEQTHTEAVRDLLEKYNITDPVTDDTIGVFQNETLAGLYDSLVAKGSDSMLAALNVGATIEDLDIRDLQDSIARTDNADIQLVYENLMRGSRNHMRAFTRQIGMLGLPYEPQYISQTEYNEIISSSQETGNGMQSGGGQGMRGWGRRQ